MTADSEHKTRVVHGIQFAPAPPWAALCSCGWQTTGHKSRKDSDAAVDGHLMAVFTR